MCHSWATTYFTRQRSVYTPTLSTTLVMLDLSLTSPIIYLPLLGLLIFTLTTFLRPPNSQARPVGADSVEKPRKLRWHQIIDAMNTITTTSSSTTWPLDEYRLIRITATCTSPISRSFEFTTTRALAYFAAVCEYETGKWKAGHGEGIDSLSCQSALATVFLPTWVSEMCVVWTDLVVLVAGGRLGQSRGKG